MALSRIGTGGYLPIRSEFTLARGDRWIRVRLLRWFSLFRGPIVSLLFLSDCWYLRRLEPFYAKNFGGFTTWNRNFGRCTKVYMIIINSIFTFFSVVFVAVWIWMFAAICYSYWPSRRVENCLCNLISYLTKHNFVLFKKIKIKMVRFWSSAFKCSTLLVPSVS